MLRIGITGQSGFIGKYLYNSIALHPDEFQRIPFDKSFFESAALLDDFVSQCDVIVHLAGLNRHNVPQAIYDTNIGLTQTLIDSLERTSSKAHIIFSSSTQEERDNLYGKSKMVSRKILGEWATRQNAKFSGLLVPNVYGPFGAPFYNSVVATFCYQLTHHQVPRIEIDGELKLIYVGELVSIILDCARNKQTGDLIEIPPVHQCKVSEILALLQQYHDNYLVNGVIPPIGNSFERNLFNTFRSYIDINKQFPFRFKQHIDQRGAFVEIIKANISGQTSFSTTHPGITRGNHFHTRKIERFAVVKGTAEIQLRKIGTDEVISLHLNGDEPAFVDMPVWYTHNIKNIGNTELLTVFWINEFFNPEDPDTFMEVV